MQAVKLSAVYPQKLWIIYGMEGGAWWEWNLATPTNCSNEEVKKFLDKAITIVPRFDGAVRGRQPAAANSKVHINSIYHGDIVYIHSLCVLVLVSTWKFCIFNIVWACIGV